MVHCCAPQVSCIQGTPPYPVSCRTLQFSTIPAMDVNYSLYSPGAVVKFQFSCSPSRVPLHSNWGIEGTVAWGMLPWGCEDTVARRWLLHKGRGGGTCQRECGSGCDPALSSAVAEYPMLTVPLVFLAVAALRSMGPHGHRCVETPPPPPPGEAGCSLCLCGLAEQLMVGVGVPDDTAEACRDAKARDAPQGRGLKRGWEAKTGS